MIEVHPGGSRFASQGPGIRSWHSFSAGSHYDAGNVAFETLVGVDEHRLAPGAGFARHAHRGVAIVTWVLAGRLRHEGADGGELVVDAGEVLVQHTGTGITHAEYASSSDELRVVSHVLIDDAPPATVVLGDGSSAATVGGAAFEIVHLTGPGARLAGPMHVFLAHGEAQLTGPDAMARSLQPGDSARVARGPVVLSALGVDRGSQSAAAVLRWPPR